MRKSKLEPFKEEIIKKYLEGEHASFLGKEFNMHPTSIINFLRKNNIKTRQPKEANAIRIKHENNLKAQRKTKRCPVCKIEKPPTKEFFGRRGTKFISCKDCVSKYNKEYHQNNKNKILKRHKNYAQNNRDKINSRKRKNNKRRYHSDINFRLRTILGKGIRNSLKKRNGSKNGASILNHLPFTIDELKQHLELLFKPWMSWKNYGPYRAKGWDNNNESTWTWQIDHIIPHSEFRYKSMCDEEFKQCWSLKNLRPLSSKQNCMDGVTRKRHYI